MTNNKKNDKANRGEGHSAQSNKPLEKKEQTIPRHGSTERKDDKHKTPHGPRHS